MNRAEMLREIRMARFEEIYDRWRRKRVTQAWAASVPGVTDRTFRRWVARYEAGGLAALKDKRVAGPSPRRASPEEVAALEALYRDGCAGWNVLHFYHEVYAGEHGGARSYTWVKSRLQEAGLVRKGRRKGAHRLRRERKPAEGMMLHQDASTHEWAPGQGWDLVVTMDDATSGVYSGFFVEEEGTWSSLRGVAETVKVQGLFDSLYTDRGSHGEFKRSSQHLREMLRWQRAGTEERIEPYVRGCVHQAVRRWDGASIGRGSGKRSLEVCRARRPPWQRVCPLLSGHAGFANVVACHHSIFVPSHGAISRSLSEKRSPFFEPVVVACARSPGSWAAHPRRSRENCGATQLQEEGTSSIGPRPLNGTPTGERNVQSLRSSLRTAN